jgi:hypothetical protein
MKVQGPSRRAEKLRFSGRLLFNAAAMPPSVARRSGVAAEARGSRYGKAELFRSAKRQVFRLAKSHLLDTSTRAL